MIISTKCNNSIYCSCFILMLIWAIATSALQQSTLHRRDLLAITSASICNFALPPAPSRADEATSTLQFSTTKSGLQWADARIGNGQTLKAGTVASIDYALSTTGARYGSKIYSNSNSGAPYRWTLGDGTTIKGIEEAIIGNDDIPAMKPGGIRRVIIPPNLAYESLAKMSEGCGVDRLGPIPPPTEAFEEFQRFKNIYCNPSRMYQPDVVMDIKLYGKRTTD